MTKKTIYILFLITFEGLFQHGFSQVIVDPPKVSDSIIACGFPFFKEPVFIDDGTKGMQNFLIKNIHIADSLDYVGGSLVETNLQLPIEIFFK